jgi:ATP:corrinoid adenosyltransferase
MATMIPNYIDQENPKLSGERIVFSLLSEESIKGYSLHSLLQKNHRHKMIGEIDFLLLCEDGFLCIEVKGGKEVYRRDGIWYSKSHNDIEYQIKDPFRQAKDCMYALQQHIRQVFGSQSEEANCIFGYAVVFPQSIFTGSGNDLVTEVLFDCKRGNKPFPDFIKDTFKFWEAQEKMRHGRVCNKLSDDKLRNLLILLRGDFAVVPSMTLEMQYIDKNLTELTEEQYDVLDVTMSNKRVLINGVAGTGKSLLALEKVRRCVASGKSALYVCFNRNMAKVARKSIIETVGEHEDLYVGTYHKLLMNEIRINCGNKFIDTEIHKLKISEMFLKENIAVKEYDCLVVDEAQDLMHVRILECLDKFIKGGMKKGEWVIFTDPNQNIFNDDDEYNFAYDFILESYSPTIMPLTKNCRNTEQIGKKTSMLTLVPPAKHMKTTGPNVVTVSYSNRREFLKSFKKELTSLFAGGILPENVVVLSKYSLQNSVLSNENVVCGLPVIESGDVLNSINRAIKYYTIQSYKGLESNVVFLIDVDGFIDINDRAINYVGMSRSKILLYIFYTADKKDEYVEMSMKGLDKLFSKPGVL